MRALSEDEIERCRLTLIGGSGLGLGVGLRVFLATTSKADSLRPELEKKAAVCEKVLDGATEISNADAEVIADLLDS